MDILQGVGLLALVAVAYFIYENYSESQLISPEEERLFRLYSDAYIDLSDDFRSERIDRSTFEKRKREILNNRGEKRKVAQRVEKQNEDELERKGMLKATRIFGYKYDESIFSIFNDKEELTWNELLDGIEKTFNLPSLGRKAREEYYENEMLTPDQVILNDWLFYSLIEICEWSAENPSIIEHFKVGCVLTQSYYQINDYDITHSVWLEDRNITLKHCEAYDLYMSRKT